MSLSGSDYQHWLDELSQHAADADAKPRWPLESWKLVKEIGGLEWVIPEKYGGCGSTVRNLLTGYYQLASSCLTSCFILTQRDGACRRLLASGRDDLCRELLPPLARGETFATVGLSQLTTSRQHIKPMFTARQDGEDFIFDGTIPWVTGASQANHIIIGATLAGGGQVLCVLPADAPGVSIGEPLELMALQGSLTTEVRCDNVRLDRHWLLAGPVEKVMQGKQGGAGGLQTSCLALGLSDAAIKFLKKEAETRPALSSGTERLDKTLERLRQDLYRMAETDTPPEAITQLRAQANTLVVQAAQAALIASKGTGFVRSHPAQRWVRQAMFFLVWSCPWPAASATLDLLTFAPDQECV